MTYRWTFQRVQSHLVPHALSRLDGPRSLLLLQMLPVVVTVPWLEICIIDQFHKATPYAPNASRSSRTNTRWQIHITETSTKLSTLLVNELTVRCVHF